ncbi:hypothetical protein, partial [Catenulispora pinisilvae]|uniref:hypothetical protein n=1 Tax=Catenulispora pinisilvae TaxID=2705253 RepID=UPI001E5DA618
LFRGAGVCGPGCGCAVGFKCFLRPSVMVVPVRGSGRWVCLSAAGFRVHDPAPPQASSTPAGLNQGLDQDQEPKQDQNQEPKQDQQQEHKQDQQQEHKQDQQQEHKQDQRQEHKQDQRQEHKQDQQQEHKQDQGQELW